MDNNILAVVAKPSPKSGRQQHSFAEAGHSGDGTEGEMNFHSMLASDTEKAGESKPTTLVQPETKDARITTDPHDEESASRSYPANEAYPFVPPSPSALEGEGDDLSLSMQARGIGPDLNMNTLQTEPDVEAPDDVFNSALDLAPTPDSMSQPPTVHASAEGIEISAILNRSLAVTQSSVNDISQALAIQTSAERGEVAAIMDRSLAMAPSTLNANTIHKALTDPSMLPGGIAGSALTRLVAAPASAVSQYPPIGTVPKAEIANPAPDLFGVEKFLSGREVSEPGVITDKVSTALAPELQRASPEHAPLGDGVFSITLADTGNAPVRGHSAHSFAPIRVSVADPRWEQAFGSHIVWMAGKRLQSASLQITPPDLGPVTVQLRVHEDNQASISFSSHHAMVREAIEAALPRLRELFTEGGLQLLDVEISNRGGARHDRGDPPWQRAADDPQQQEKTSSLAETPVEATSGRAHQGLLDTFA